MEQTEHEQTGRGGINNYFYGNDNKVINLKLTQEQIAVLGSGNQLARNINNLFNTLTDQDHGK